MDLEWVYQSITSKRSDKQLLRSQEGGGGGCDPPSGQIGHPKWFDHRRVNFERPMSLDWLILAGIICVSPLLH